MAIAPVMPAALDGDDDRTVAAEHDAAAALAVASDVHAMPFPQSVAAAVILRCIDDLQGRGGAKQCADARAAVAQGALDCWVELLGLSERAAQRVGRLLDDLARTAG